MIKLGNFIVVLDACVLYKDFLRNLLLRIAKYELYQPRWSDKICEEFSRNLIKNKATSPDKAQRTIFLMNKAFSEAQVDEYIEINLDGMDPKDKHIVETAVASNAQVIVTDNLKHFPDEILGKYNIETQSPDEFLQNLFDLAPEVVLNAFIEMENSLNNPPLSRENILTGLARQVPVFTEQLREYLFTYCKIC